MKVKTLKKIRFQLKHGHIRGENNEKCLNWSMVGKLLLEKVQMQLWQNILVTKGILSQP